LRITFNCDRCQFDHAEAIEPGSAPLGAASRGDKSLTEFVRDVQPRIGGCIADYGHFYKVRLRPTLLRIDA
jgi:hypothetical protein